MFFDLLGTFVKEAGSLMATGAEATSAKYNQTIDNYNANVTTQEGQVAAQQARQQGIEAVGQNIANAGAGGFSSTSGSAVDVIRTSSYNASMNVLNVQYSYAAKAKSFENQATLQGDRAKQSEIGGEFDAAGILISGVGRADKAKHDASAGNAGSYNINGSN